MKSGRKITQFEIGLLIFGVILLAGLLIFKHSPATTNKTSSKLCINQQLAIGSSGKCVSDAQTMIDFMESDGLNQCPFIGANPLTINGNYDSVTIAQVKVVQTWLNCYNHQEGQTATFPVNGDITSSTWSGLCTYAYQYPSQSNQSSSSYLNQSIAAGKNAGC